MADIMHMTREEFLAIENFGEHEKFEALIIVPTDELHDSGWRTMKFILVRENEIVGAVSGYSDVININGIGGYGKDYKEALRTQKVPVIGWKIDCLPVSGCLSLWCGKLCSAAGWIGSDFEFFVEDK